MLYELKAIRKRSNLSQKEAAEQLGVNPGTYRNWEQCKNQPQKSSEVKRLADFFGVTVSELYGYDLAAPGVIAAAMGALDAEQVEFWVRRVMGRSDPLEAVRLFVRRVVVDRAAGTLTAEFTFEKKKEPPPDGPGRGSRKYLGAGLRRLTANTSMYALPCGFAVVGESPRLAR